MYAVVWSAREQCNYSLFGVIFSLPELDAIDRKLLDDSEMCNTLLQKVKLQIKSSRKALTESLFAKLLKNKIPY